MWGAVLGTGRRKVGVGARDPLSRAAKPAVRAAQQRPGRAAAPRTHRHVCYYFLCVSDQLSFSPHTCLLSPQLNLLFHLTDKFRLLDVEPSESLFCT